MAAYAFARIKFRFNNALFLVFLITLMVPVQVTMVPLFMLMRILGLVNTYPGLILPGVTSAFGVFLLRQFFLTIPRNLEEAAFLDGASHWTVFWRIVMPLSKPGLAALTIFAFMSYWNAFLWPLLITTNNNMATLPLMTSLLQNQYTSLLEPAHGWIGYLHHPDHGRVSVRTAALRPGDDAVGTERMRKEVHGRRR